LEVCFQVGVLVAQHRPSGREWIRANTGLYARRERCDVAGCDEMRQHPSGLGVVPGKEQMAKWFTGEMGRRAGPR